MRWLRRWTLPLLVIACMGSMIVGCKSSPPELAGKWSGRGDLSTEVSTAPGSVKTQAAKSVPVEVTLTLNQNGNALAGDAAVTISNQPAVHLPVTAGAIGQDGKVSIEADRSGFSNVHLSFTGNVASGRLTGDVALKMDTLLGVAINKGALTLKQGS